MADNDYKKYTKDARKGIKGEAFFESLIVDKMKHENPGAPALKMRIGINTGPVVVGTLGNDLRVEFKAVGDTVNLASPMAEVSDCDG